MKIFKGPATTTSDAATTRKKAPTYGPRIGWGILTVCLSIFSVACLGSLVVVATVKNADALSTVALALAVISFAAQLIVTLAQGHSTAQLNAETQAALTGIQTAADSLLTKQSGQFETMLNALLQGNSGAAKDGAPGAAGGQQAESPLSAELREMLTRRLVEALFNGAGTATPSIAAQEPGAGID